jgi:hypothetical protein
MKTVTNIVSGEQEREQMIKWKMEYVARLFIEGGFQAIADAHNREGCGGIVMRHPPTQQDKRIEGIDFPVPKRKSMASTIKFKVDRFEEMAKIM